jgi:hypothetical protein
LSLYKDRVYIEFGSGGSTLIAHKIFNEIYSMDTDKNWVKMINLKLKSNKVKFVDIGEVLAWGYPKIENEENFKKIVHCFDEILIKYKEKDKIIFIDGRARLAISINILKFLKNSDIIMIHDFTERPEYYELLNYYKIINVFDTLVVLRKNDRVENDLLQFDFR